MKLSEQLKVGEPVPNNVIDLFLDDKRHSDGWRDEAIHAYDFIAGRQWTDDEIKALKKQKRPVVVFNRAKTVIDAVSGNEIGNRREVRYIPREQGDVKANELYTAAGDWFRDRSHADDNETDSFSDTLITGMGWTETRIDFDMSVNGEPIIDRVDPLEFAWDRNAKKRNITDAKRIWRFRTVPYAEAQSMIEDKTRLEMDARWTEAVNASDYGYSNRDSDRDEANNPDVTIVHLQWLERRTFYRAQDPFTGEQGDFSAEEYATINERLTKLMGMGLQGQKYTKLVRMQAMLGHNVLSVSEAPSQKGYSWSCITGYRDRNKNLFYGMVRAMIDPQTWANKWLSQTMHIMNTNAKGGLMAEKGAFESQDQAEKSWADPTKITWLKDGALQQGRIKEKTASTMPNGFQQLTEFGVSSIRDVTGVSLELLGMREANQAASLEYQRRQSGMAILQPLFDGLKHYREIQGAVMLDFIQNDLSDGRLVRIAGEGAEQYVPLLKQADAEYDIIVDDAPTAPNQKEMVWQMFMQLLPTMGKMFPPQFMAKMLAYSPLPSSVTEELEKIASAPNPQAQEQQQIEKAGAMAEVKLTESQAMLNQAKAQEAAGSQQAGQASVAVEMQQAQMDMALSRAEFAQTMQQMQMQREADAARHAADMEKIAAQLMLISAQGQAKRQSA